MTITSGSVICFCLPGNSPIPLEEGWLDGFCGKEAAFSQSTLWDVVRSLLLEGTRTQGFVLPSCWTPALCGWRASAPSLPDWWTWLLFSYLQVQPIVRLSMYSRDPLRDRGNTYMASLKYKKSSSPSHYSLLSSCQMINLWPESLGLCIVLVITYPTCVCLWVGFFVTSLLFITPFEQKSVFVW